MSQDILQQVAIDAAVAGALESSSPAWERLVSNPEAETQWRDASTRRANAEHLVHIAQQLPWVGRTALTFRRATRAARRAATGWTELSVGVDTFASQLDGADAAPVGSSENGLVRLAWGESKVVSVPLGLRVMIQPPSGCRLYYRSGNQSGLLGRGWKMEAGDGPVVIMTIAEGRDVPGDLDEALATQTPASMLILVEPAAGEKSG